MEDKDWIFEKMPSWLRWILAIPVALIGSIVVPMICRFCINWTLGSAADGIITQLFIMITSVLGLLGGLYYCVPKYKEKITGVACIVLAIYFSVILTLMITRGIAYFEDYVLNGVPILFCIVGTVKMLSGEKVKEVMGNNF